MKGLLLLSLPLLFAAPAAADDAKTIYGADSRKDFYEVRDAVQRAAMPAAVSLFNARALADAGSAYAVSGPTLGHESRGLCPSERFFEQQTGAFCSGTLIAPDLVLTAGHCMGKKDKPATRCQSTRFAFGFSIGRAGEQASLIEKTDVYSCARVEIYSHNATSDFAVVRLDRAVTGRRPARLYTERPPAEGGAIFTVGGPYGLPLKVVGDAEVRSLSDTRTFFRTNLDTSGGNSGGGIFCARTGLLVGVHTASWDPDLEEVPLPANHGLPVGDARVKSGKCKVVSEFGQDEGRGKKGYALSAITGLAALAAGGSREITVDMPPVTAIPAERADLSRFGLP